MNNKSLLFISVIQLILGLAAIAAFVLFTVVGESVEQWIVAFLLAFVLISLGISGIVKYIKQPK